MSEKKVVKSNGVRQPAWAVSLICGVMMGCILLPAEVSAANLFKNPKQWFEEVGREAEKDTKRILREAGNILSLGEIQRQIERDRADQARREAEQAQRFAQETQKREIAQLRSVQATHEAQLKVLKINEENLARVKTTAESHLHLVDELAESLEFQSAEYETLVRLIEVQQRDLLEWLPRESVTEGIDSLNANLLDKMEIYLEQVDSIPRQSTEVDNYEFLINLFEAGHALLDFVDESQKEVSRQIQITENQIEQISQSLARLQ